jgi:hypothetical protein
MKIKELEILSKDQLQLLKTDNASCDVVVDLTQDGGIPALEQCDLPKVGARSYLFGNTYGFIATGKPTSELNTSRLNQIQERVETLWGKHTTYVQTPAEDNSQGYPILPRLFWSMLLETEVSDKYETIIVVGFSEEYTDVYFSLEEYDPTDYLDLGILTEIRCIINNQISFEHLRPNSVLSQKMPRI